VFIASWIILKLFREIGLSMLNRLAKKTQTDADDFIVGLLQSLGWPFYLVISLYMGFHFVEIPDTVWQVFTSLAYLIVIYYIVKGIHKLIDFSVSKYVAREKASDKKFDSSVAELLAKLLKYFLWIIAFLVFLQNLGYEITALIAGLGIGGIAIAFAMQNILADIFAYFTISFDRPFKIGDYIMIGTDIGVVRKIGLKSTRIQTFQGEELIVSNRDLTNSRVRNYKRMENRKVSFDIIVSTDTETKKLESIPGFMEGLLRPIKMASFERAYFKSIASNGLIFEVSYKVLSPKYRDYLSIQHKVNLGIKAKFERTGIKLLGSK
jgi:small-conductance mechanosensitive channel